MESLYSIQCDCKASIERAYKNFKKSPKDRLTRAYIETRLESLESSWLEFKVTHKDIIKTPSSDLKDKYVTSNYYDDTEELFMEYKTELKGALEKLSREIPKHSQEADSKPNSSCNTRLPKITIPVFSGEYTSWTSFKELFISLVDKNDSLDSVQKLHYLKGQITGEAEQLVRHIPIAGDNYEQCWNVLKNRYDNKKFLANCWLKRLINQNCMKDESASGIKNLLDTTVESLNSLKYLGVDVSSWDIFVVFIISSKLDMESRKQWELHSSSPELPTFKNFESFLESRFRALENVDDCSKRSFSKQKVLHAINSPNAASSVSCQFCNGAHRIINCKSFINESPEIRYNFVQTNRLCFNCLGTHSIKFCRQTTSCHICHKRHHSLIHRQIPESSSNKIEKNM